MSHTFNEEQAWEFATNRVKKDEHRGAWTIFGVACIGPDHTSHGVTVTSGAGEAFEAAKDTNEITPDGECTYYPVGITIIPEMLVALMHQLAEEPPEGRQG